MYITEIHIRRIKSILTAKWALSADRCPGWHVIIGDNGAGKSTFVRSVALSLVGPAAEALREDWNDWLTREQDRGSIFLKLSCDGNSDKVNKASRPDISSLSARTALARDGDRVWLHHPDSKPDPRKYVWGNGPGWFSASYGPFRRFTGGDPEYGKLFYSRPKLAPHLSAFGESVALTECLSWLQDLQFKVLEADETATALLRQIYAFVNQEGFLPHGAKLQSVTSKEVLFKDGNGYELPVEQLSDGYRSLLSLTFELIRQMDRAYEHAPIFGETEDGGLVVVQPGVVLIDEADVHLHPTWQRKVGVWFRKHFPNIQFIVTTHSPLICQAADVGTVWRLPKPGTDEQGGFVTGVELERLIYGNVLDAYGTELFGSDVTRSDESRKMLDRLAELNVKELNGGLTASERKEQERLRATLPTSAYETTAEVAD